MKKKSNSKSAFFNLRVLIAAVLCLAGVLWRCLDGHVLDVFAQTRQSKHATAQDAPGTQTPDVVRMVGPVRLDQDLRDLPYVAPKAEHEEQPLYRHPRPNTAATNFVSIRNLRPGTRSVAVQKHLATAAHDARTATDVRGT